MVIRTRCVPRLLSALLLLPWVARGQEVSRVPESPTAAPEPAQDYSFGAHLALGTSLGLVGVLSGAGLGKVGAEALGPKCSYFACRDYLKLSLFAGVGGTLGAALPIYFTGNLFDGQGRFGYTLLGAALGAMPSALFAFRAVGDAELIGAVFYCVTPIVGGFLGYGLSHRSAVARPPPRMLLPGAQVVPVVTMSREGGLVGGLAGRF